MSISKYVKQVRNRQENKVDHLERITDLIQEDAMNLPIDIFRGLDYSKSSKLSSSKRDVIIVRSPDRETDRDEILRNLRQAGVDAKLGDSQSSVDPIDGTFEDRPFRIFVKPQSGGMGETTLNASMTELFPCIAFEKKYKNWEKGLLIVFSKYNSSTLKCFLSNFASFLTAISSPPVFR